MNQILKTKPVVYVNNKLGKIYSYPPKKLYKEEILLDDSFYSSFSKQDNEFSNEIGIFFNKVKKKVSSWNRPNFFKILFIFSSTLLLLLISTFFLLSYRNQESEKIARRLVSNFNISSLYSQTSDYQTNKTSENSSPQVIGLIEIPTIKLNYPILSNMSDELLKISPCKFYGPNPNEAGNLCIAGHNYDNYKFFSKIHKLKNGDTIKIHDVSGNIISYEVYENKEVNSDDISCTNQNTNGKREITLVTCNNLNNNRVIIKAVEKKTQK